MTDDLPTSRKVPPLVIIVVVVLAALAAIAFANWRTTQHPPHGGPSMPQSGSGQPVMPQQSTVPNRQAPASDERGAMGHHDNANEPGGPATTANVVGSTGR